MDKFITALVIAVAMLYLLTLVWIAPTTVTKHVATVFKRNNLSCVLIDSYTTKRGSMFACGETMIGVREWYEFEIMKRDTWSISICFECRVKERHLYSLWDTIILLNQNTQASTRRCFLFNRTKIPDFMFDFYFLYFVLLILRFSILLFIWIVRQGHAIFSKSVQLLLRQIKGVDLDKQIY